LDLHISSIVGNQPYPYTQPIKRQSYNLQDSLGLPLYYSSSVQYFL
jgi:hypothetical protein